MATSLKPPTGNPQGYVDTTAAWAGNTSWASILYDFAETIGDVMWPTSVWTYSQMRRDPRLTAILAAYTRPILRASWGLNPAGCRDEVVQLVSDDLDLTIIGGDQQPKAARTRGVSWPQHCRMALLDLVYGHMGFELGAEIDAQGRARLVSLSERMPQTISQIHVDRYGDFAGASQWSLPGDPKAPDMPATSMVWYAHEREGAQWQGHSLLRSSYAPWLLKREMQRVHATGNRRFNHGIPTVRWDTGSNPTPAQHTAAQQVAESMRGGDQAGAALPPGARIELVGLTGSVPDTLGFLNWLNGEMSAATLTHFLDLVTSTHGSRALGQAFIDYFLLAIQAIAEEVADTATRQAAARIVDWNWGPDEPVPAINVADVGSRHEVTAEALNQLMAYGAIMPDPALEAYVRGEYALPQRTTPQPALVPGQSTQAPSPGINAGRGLPKGQARAAATPGPRDLTPAEQAAGVDFQAQQAAHDAAVAQVRQDWPADIQPVVDALIAAALAAVAAGTLGNLGNLVVPAGLVDQLADLIAGQMADLAGQTAAAVVAEAASQGVTIPVPDDPGVDHLHEVATAVAQQIAGRYAAAAGQAALHAGTDPEAVEQAVRDAADTITGAERGVVNDQLGAAMHAAQRTGRFAVYEAGPPARYAASEVMDNNTCQPCADIDGHQFDSLEEASAAYATGGYVGCLGGLRCRGIIIAVWGDEETPQPDETAPPEEPADPIVAAFTSEADQLAQAVDTGVLEETPLGNGSLGEVTRVTTRDGTTLVRKVTNDSDPDLPSGQQQDAEQLGALVARTVGLASPAVHRVSTDEVLMSFMDGTLADLLPDEGAAILATDEGTRLRLLDLLISNRDRHPGNWLAGQDGAVQSIDTGLGFQEWAPPGQVPGWPDDMLAPFATWDAITHTGAWVDNPLHPDDVATLRDRLEALRPVFDELGRGNWLDVVLTTLDSIGQHATGTVRLVT